MHDGKIEGRRERLRLWSIAVPLAGLAVLYPLRAAFLHIWPVAAADALTGLLMTVGVLAFSWMIFRVIERQDRDLARQHAALESGFAVEHRLRAQLEALHQASLALASAGASDQVLQRLVELARDLIGARYAALGVLGPQGAVDGFYTTGLSQEERERLGPPPQGHGLLDVLFSEGTALRVADVAQDPHSVGFPNGHPSMTSLLGVPVAHGGHVVGQLYLADKIGAATFSPEDERLLVQLAGHAAVVIEHARLAERVQALAVAAERYRIGQELHDGVIQTLYAVNLELEDAAEDVDVDPASVRGRIDEAIDRLGAVMAEMRRYILGLQAENTATQPLSESLAALLSEASTRTLIKPHLCVDGGRADRLRPVLKEHLLYMAREAVTNVIRHARASHVWVTLEMAGHDVHLRIVDDGVGFDTTRAAQAGGAGLCRLRERARDLGGTLMIQSTSNQGTTVDVRMPIAAPQWEEAHA